MFYQQDTHPIAAKRAAKLAAKAPKPKKTPSKYRIAHFVSNNCHIFLAANQKVDVTLHQRKTIREKSEPQGF